MRRELDRRTRELVEAREQQAASSEVLDIISSSPGELKRVFQSILANAIRLCGARFGNLFLHNDGVFRAVAQHNAPRLYAAALRRPIHIRDNPRVPLARIAVTKQPVHISNLAREQAYIDRDPRMLLLVDVARARTLLVVPMLKQEELIGAIGLYRPIVRPFSEKQIALIKIFANQAAIAIQNTRLVNELRERTDQLQLANLAKSRFLAVASHDLRQPLHALGLFVAQLRSNADSTERSRIIAQINAAVTAMNELFNALLDISKLDADVLKPNLTRFPIQHVFTRLKTTFADAAHEKALKLRVVPSNAWVYSDLILLERIMLNLASNGVRYTVRGGVVVGARRRGNVLRLEVWDSGPGIPEDQRKNIFGEFYQIASAQGSHAAGLGLGLAIVERLCGLLDHRLEMTSVVGRGSRFAILVPLTSAGTELVEPSAPIHAINDSCEGKFVVVVDDDPMVLDGMRGLLTSWGCRAVTADCGQAALARVAEHGQTPDLIISDYRLQAGRNGFDLIAKMRSTYGHAIPAFLMSGDTSPERLREAAISGYQLLHKPVQPMALRAMLVRFLKMTQTRRLSRS